MGSARTYLYLANDNLILVDMLPQIYSNPIRLRAFNVCYTVALWRKSRAPIGGGGGGGGGSGGGVGGASSSNVNGMIMSFFSDHLVLKGPLGLSITDC